METQTNGDTGMTNDDSVRDDSTIEPIKINGETIDEMDARIEREISESGVMTEAQMRDAEVPWPHTPEELAAYIKSLVERPHDYGTSAYAMSMAAQAAFNYVGHALGTTGFQASCADLDFLRRTRMMKHGFRIINYNDLLYPQSFDKCNIRAVDLLADNATGLKKAVSERIEESPDAHPNVMAHWRMILALPDSENGV